jgi:hypothetical protein
VDRALIVADLAAGEQPRSRERTAALLHEEDAATLVGDERDGRDRH